MTVKFGVFVDEDHSKLPTIYWLPKRHKRPYKSCLIANSSSCTTTKLFILVTSCLTAIKNHVIKYCTTVMKGMVKIYFGLLKIQVKFLINNSKGFLASSLSTYDFSTLYTTLPNNLIKERLTKWIEQTFNREGSLYLACNDKTCYLDYYTLYPTPTSKIMQDRTCYFINYTFYPAQTSMLSQK